MRTKTAVKFTFTFLISTSALGQGTTDSSMKGMDMSRPAATRTDTKPEAEKMDRTAEPVALTDGEVRKLDRDRGLVTLKHGEIRSLGMPGMTMVFHATDKAMLQNIKEGDKVKFAADLVNSQLAVTRIEMAP